MNMLSPRHRICWSCGRVGPRDGRRTRVLDPRGHRPRGGRRLRAGGLCSSASCGRSSLKCWRNTSKRCCFARAQRRRLRRLLCQRAVHPLVSTIVLRRSRTAEMRLDAQLQQPNRQSRKPTRADDPNGGPLSERTASGSPKSLKRSSKTGLTSSWLGLRIRTSSR